MNTDQTINTDERVARARELFLSGYNCSQAVFCALADIYHIPDDQAKRLAASFGGGVGRLREMCGACLGMTMLEGLQSAQRAARMRRANRPTIKMCKHWCSVFVSRTVRTYAANCCSYVRMRP